ncbi:unnamed protein product [Pieris macdunnoughi]|uniref:Serpin domain-containing protein n=1 Tax=Pieris macdunnoughi TaxID=345717 RepID=A0A821MYQ5_9NEOP|nr:unnamed protein product [Pieris macdunnoughi]
MICENYFNTSSIFSNWSNSNIRSDLSGILKYPEPIYVSSAIQKAKITVNEDGSEAAAGNAAVIGIRTAPMTPVNTFETFNANRPFLYYVLFENAPIFAGLYAGEN